MQDDVLFPVAEPQPVPVVMSLSPEYYALMWERKKDHEFRRRYLAGRPTQWFVYLTVPASRLCAVIDLDTAIEDTPTAIATIAEQMRTGNGQSVYDYLAAKGSETGYAMPIRRVREFEGFSADDLARMLDGFHPPQGYTRVDHHPGWGAVCDKLLSTPIVRQITTTPSPPDQGRGA